MNEDISLFIELLLLLRSLLNLNNFLHMQSVGTIHLKLCL